MLATPGTLPAGPEWLFEVKWDGVRLLADVVDGVLRLTAAGRDVTATFPELAGIAALAPDVLLDGEVVMLEAGVPSFAALNERMYGPLDPRAVAARPVTFMVFDILRLYGVPLVERPYEERRGTLERMDLAAVPTMMLSPSYSDGEALLIATAQRGMEGVIAKRRDCAYQPGRRSGCWVGVTHRQARVCVVGGWLPGRSRIGSLLLGVHEPSGLRYAGRVGVGAASDVAVRMLEQRLEPARRSPFAEPPPRADATGARWCLPTVAVEVSHDGHARSGTLRRTVYRGVRDDVEPDQVART
ncbi:DNA ligase [Actinomycetes bacterium KLBMP 9759]